MKQTLSPKSVQDNILLRTKDNTDSKKKEDMKSASLIINSCKAPKKQKI